MTDTDSGDAADGTTVLIHSYPMLDFFVIGMVSSLFTIGVIALTVRTWQLFVQDSTVLLPGIIGTVVALGTIFVIPFRASTTEKPYTKLNQF